MVVMQVYAEPEIPPRFFLGQDQRLAPTVTTKEVFLGYVNSVVDALQNEKERLAQTGGMTHACNVLIQSCRECYSYGTHIVVTTCGGEDYFSHKEVLEVGDVVFSEWCASKGHDAWLRLCAFYFDVQAYVWCSQLIDAYYNDMLTAGGGIKKELYGRLLQLCSIFEQLKGSSYERQYAHILEVYRTLVSTFM